METVVTAVVRKKTERRAADPSLSTCFCNYPDDGSVVTWGSSGRAVQNQLKGVQEIQASSIAGLVTCAFAVILADGSVVTWGARASRAVQDQLKGAQQIQAVERAFAII